MDERSQQGLRSQNLESAAFIKSKAHSKKVKQELQLEVK